MGDEQVFSPSTTDIPEILPGPAETSQGLAIGVLDSNLASQNKPKTPDATMQQVSSRGSQQAGTPGTQKFFDMGALGSTLPDISHQNYSNVPLQRHHSAGSPQNMMYPQQHMPQFTSMNMSNSNSANGIYNMQYSPQFQAHYAMNNITNTQNVSSGMSPSFQFYPMQGFVGQQPQLAPLYFQQGQYSMQHQMYAANAGQGQYGVRPSFLPEHRLPQQGRGREVPVEEPSPSRSSGRSGSNASGSGRTSVVRGPPRKPRQSGHAIWIGNLPPQTDLMSLVHHVCKETPKLESLFLISKSNCAFANFRDEASCTAAQMKIHESRFQTVRLVSRLRRSSVGTAGASIPTGPAALSPPSFPTQQIVVSSSPETSHTTSPSAAVQSPDGVPKDKFFIVKSLTVEDLELSVRNGIWATQSHNEESLNKAYQSVDNVYLIFSANKSGEYFGYARMASEINDDPAAAIEFAPSVHTVEDPELPKAIPTPATECTPKGRIIDDSARGTIFWEVERDESESIDGIVEEDEGETSIIEVDPDTSSPQKAWGKPFRIEWISTNRLPFYRTRGLRNPWNSNREVKIARDGTELETSIGRRLTGLFHRTPSPSAMFLPSAPAPLVGGFPPAHPQH